MPRKVQVSHAEFAAGVEGARIVQSDTLEARNTTTSVVYYSTGHVSLYSERNDGTSNLFQFYAPVVPVVQPKPEGIAPGEPLTLEDSVVDQIEETEAQEEAQNAAEKLVEFAQSNPDVANLLRAMTLAAQAEAPAPAPVPQVVEDPMAAALRNRAAWERMYPGIPWRGS